jgi:hypothetical protein
VDPQCTRRALSAILAPLAGFAQRVDPGNKRRVT